MNVSDKTLDILVNDYYARRQRMTLWNWLLTKLGKRFPLPPRHILTYEEIKKYWAHLPTRWRQQCCLIVMRIRKPERGRQNIWRPHDPSSDPQRLQFWSARGTIGTPFTLDYFPTISEIRAVFGYADGSQGDRSTPTDIGTWIAAKTSDESPDPFTIRIDREWEVQPGIKKKEELCIANFEL
jgi:hypothetical protein